VQYTAPAEAAVVPATRSVEVAQPQTTYVQATPTAYAPQYQTIATSYQQALPQQYTYLTQSAAPAVTVPATRDVEVVKTEETKEVKEDKKGKKAKKDPKGKKGKKTGLCC